MKIKHRNTRKPHTSSTKHGQKKSQGTRQSSFMTSSEFVLRMIQNKPKS